ncbi:uncharacterized protein BX664DRAFT_340850 [Halteromyces radiatus]|uniref:uncharacterized protein n=1 Tax=Halteromyces radiatus TaxID=101107 RepID=UPI00221E72A0|nr:uncharacterized protein BX664DRAFT_340850 [Halteromyces radiatus]KAI8081625.1 hypothetical protein BX664DRAFT_340850 [Halteromyces radiatus]
MPIVGHDIDEQGRLKFLVKSHKHQWIDPLTIQQVLKSQPSQIPIYQYFYRHIRRPSKNQNELPPKALDSMVLDYIDVDHVQAALELIESCMTSNSPPSTTVILILVDLLLKHVVVTSKRQLKEILQQHYKIHSLLLNILELFGPNILLPIWSKFGEHSDQKRLQPRRSVAYYADHRHKRQRYNHHSINFFTDTNIEDHDDEIQHGTKLSRFDDFWHLALYCFTAPLHELSLDTLGCRLLLDILVRMISEDIQLKRDQQDSLDECLLLKTIPKNAYNERTQFDRQIDTILSGLNPGTAEKEISLSTATMKQISSSPSSSASSPVASSSPSPLSSPSLSPSFSPSSSPRLALSSLPTPASLATLQQRSCYNGYAGNIQYASKLLNLLTMLLPSAHLAGQTYPRLMTLEIDTMLHILRSIQNPVFVFYVCDLYFRDSDSTCVPTIHQHYKRISGQFKVEKLTKFVMKTRPRGKWTMKSIYTHCSLVMQQWMAYIYVTSHRYDTLSSSSSTTTTKVVTIDQSNNAAGITVDDMNEWKQHISTMIESIDRLEDSNWTTKIEELFETMENSLVV